ncbi:MAG TPA: hypothetical protein DG048_12915 [Pseudoalteromonas sp.]|nr:hypothetical protein [Pseudoalteromonas sp.]|tara:strand:+ start:3044 stop:3985 length:942 start_codon:yes stop_codon:yes gene_type:complete
MKKFLFASSVIASLVSMSSASAAIILPGGIALNPQNTDLDVGIGNFNNSFEFIQWWDNTSNNTSDGGFEQADFLQSIVDSSGAFNESAIADYENNWKLNGVGDITMPSTLETGKLSCSSCELTFEFGGIGLTSTRDANNSFTGWELNLDGSFLNVYLDNTPDFEIGSVDAIGSDAHLTDAQYDKVTDGDAWLTLAFEDSYFNPGNTSTDPTGGLLAGDSYFSFSVTGGTAVDNFVSNSIRNAQTNIFGQPIAPEFYVYRDILGLGMSAAFGDAPLSSGTSGNLTGVAISAPSTIAFFGLGLVGLSLASRRRNK